METIVGLVALKISVFLTKISIFYKPSASASLFKVGLHNHVSLVDYNQIAHIFQTHRSNLPLNLMTVCESNDNELISMTFQFLVTTEGASEETESTTDSLNLIREIDTPGYSNENLIQIVINTNNEYHLYLEGQHIFPDH